MALSGRFKPTSVCSAGHPVKTNLSSDHRPLAIVASVQKPLGNSNKLQLGDQLGNHLGDHLGRQLDNQLNRFNMILSAQLINATPLALMDYVKATLLPRLQRSPNWNALYRGREAGYVHCNCGEEAPDHLQKEMETISS